MVLGTCYRYNEDAGCWGNVPQTALGTFWADRFFREKNFLDPSAVTAQDTIFSALGLSHRTIEHPYTTFIVLPFTICEGWEVEGS